MVRPPHGPLGTFGRLWLVTSRASQRHARTYAAATSVFSGMWRSAEQAAWAGLGRGAKQPSTLTWSKFPWKATTGRDRPIGKVN